MATTTPPRTAEVPPPPRLRVHVLGGFRGESIILELPDGQWGVVDCYAPRLRGGYDSSQTLRFLRKQGVRRLAFLCLTHPHDDHYRGMSHLLENLEVAEFWRFGTWTRDELLDLLRGLDAEALRREHVGRRADKVLRWEDNNLRQAVNDLRLTLRLAGDPAKAEGVTRITGLSDVKLLYATTVGGGGHPLAIRSLAPSTKSTDEYLRSVVRYARWADDPAATPEAPPPLPRHNDVSAALLVEYGATRLMLGGDVEVAGWVDAIAAADRTQTDLSVHFVKVSHHGSTNGYSLDPDLWQRFAARGEPVAVVTRFGSRLPAPAALAHIRRYTRRLWSTSPRPAGASPPTPETAAVTQYRFWEDFESDLGRQVVARATFSSFITEYPEGFGICSVEWDHLGNALTTTCHGAAETLATVPTA